MTKKNTFKYFTLLLLIGSMVFTLACSDVKEPDYEFPEHEIETNDPINSFFIDEVKPGSTPECFQGAYYRKLVSSKDRWLGIEGTVTLPTITFDKSRIHPTKPEQYLDNPSIYIGGNMDGQETDIGLTWEVIRDKDGNISKDRKAYRPFMRRTSHKSGEKALYQNAPAEDKYYWYPEDKVTLSIKIVENSKLRFIVEGEGKRFETDFEAAGYIKGNKGEFKRVNAIDQFFNEGKSAKKTKTKVENSYWSETHLFRLYKNEIVKVPLHPGRSIAMRCPNIKYFTISASETEKKNGAETIDINGDR